MAMKELLAAFSLRTYINYQTLACQADTTAL